MLEEGGELAGFKLLAGDQALQVLEDAAREDFAVELMGVD